MTTEETVRQLDARGERWDMYRLATGGWAIQLGEHHHPTYRTVTAPTIEGVLAAALDSKPIPTIPPRPQPIHVDDYVLTKSGNRWIASEYRTRNPINATFPTRKALVEMLGRFAAHRETEIADWDRQYDQLTRDGVEGDDYQWAKN